MRWGSAPPPPPHEGTVCCRERGGAGAGGGPPPPLPAVREHVLLQRARERVRGGEVLADRRAVVARGVEPEVAEVRLRRRGPGRGRVGNVLRHRAVVAEQAPDQALG